MSSKTTTTTSTEPDGGTTTTTTTETAPVSVAEGECVRDFLPAAPESVGVSSAALGRLTGLLQEMVADRPGLGPSYPHARCKVVKGGKLIYDETSSASGFETPTDDSIYRWYSMSKIVTSVAIMQCFEKGLLKITDPVSKYIPAFGATKVYTGSTKGPAPEPLASLGIPEVPTELQLEELQRQVTIKDLLTHTAGLGYGGLGLSLGSFDDVDLWYMLNGFPAASVAGAMFGAGDAYSSLEGMCDVLAGMPLKFQPGSKFEYGLGHFVAGRIVEIVSGLPFLTYLEQEIFSPLGMSTASFGEDAAANPNVLKLWAYGPEEMTGTLFDLEGLKFGRDAYRTSEVGSLTEVGSTLPAEMHFDHCKRAEYIQAVKAKKAPISGDAGMTGTADDYFKFMCMLVNGGTGAGGARILGPKTIELMFKNHLPDGQSVAELENSANSAGLAMMSDCLPIAGMGYGLGGIVPIGDGHQVKDGCLAMPEGSYSWAGIAGTDVIIDPANDLAILFATQVMFTGFNTDAGSMAATGKHAHYVMAAINQA